jgi:hypothetical protein
VQKRLRAEDPPKRQRPLGSAQSLGQPLLDRMILVVPEDRSVERHRERLSGTSEVPQLTDPLCVTRKSAEVVHLP